MWRFAGTSIPARLPAFAQRAQTGELDYLTYKQSGVPFAALAKAEDLIRLKNFLVPLATICLSLPADLSPSQPFGFTRVRRPYSSRLLRAFQLSPSGGVIRSPAAEDEARHKRQCSYAEQEPSCRVGDRLPLPQRR